ERHDFLAVNVIGIIQGSDEKLRDSYILVSAHYDHLGIGIPFGSDSIYNGLTDNALGCAVTLEIARRIMETKSKPKRSIIFLFTTAEEQGLLGSTYYCDYPARPLHKTVLNINIDGIAFLDRFKSVVAIGAEFLDNIDVLDKVLEQNNLYLSELPAFALDNSFVYSDNYSFARNGVPALLIMDGLDLENLSQEEALEKFYYYANNIYHTPNDDFKFQVNYEAVLQHANLLFDIVTALANSPLQPIWKQTSPFYDAWLRINAQKK
ncbi:MAG TPA: M20/M25/M40 family metallo-hydrolase, partial [Candidatus Kapabacteria bacterium]|nr:M20/M25/M40 family metallo-hydrolase [Candidatus Kapabacteria bacterium]